MLTRARWHNNDGTVAARGQFNRFDRSNFAILRTPPCVLFCFEYECVSCSQTVERMKKLFLAVLAASTLISARAQWLGPNAANGAFFGGLAGGIIGNNFRGHHIGEGIAIGAASGLFLGALADDAAYRHYGGYYDGWYGAYSYPSYGYYSYSPYYRVRYYGYYPATYYYDSAPVVYQTAPATTQPADPPQSGPPATVNNNRDNSSPMSGANSLFGR